ncbi:MAG: hypothetical protein HC780_27290 [Leptolyngbyaceae cyanobacterium CSU_1_3]|nr:hypothetical protein [Leptolyngbyaceae cyanobacterium CSU_1_3]
MVGTTTRTIKAILAPTVMSRRILIHDNATIDIHEHFAHIWILERAIAQHHHF